MHQADAQHPKHVKHVQMGEDNHPDLLNTAWDFYSDFGW